MGTANKTVDLTCPSCGSRRIRRSHRRGFVERIGLRFLWMRPFHCLDCYKRFYSHSGPMNVQQNGPPVTTDHPTLPQNQPSLQTGIPVDYGQVERRGFSRLRCLIPARVVVGSAPPITGIVSGISLTGCFIETPRTIPVGSEIDLALEFGEETQSRGLIRRLVPARGMGIEFILMTAPNFRRLQSIARDSVRLQVSP